ncbi:hypothetical protein CapIbe_014429 [Capra ibex]
MRRDLPERFFSGKKQRAEQIQEHGLYTGVCTFQGLATPVRAPNVFSVSFPALPSLLALDHRGPRQLPGALGCPRVSTGTQRLWRRISPEGNMDLASPGSNSIQIQARLWEAT